MTVKEKYQQLVDRVNLPENREKHKNCLNHPNDKDRELADLFDEVRNYLKHFDEDKELPAASLNENVIKNKLHRIEVILVEKGWAK